MKVYYKICILVIFILGITAPVYAIKGYVGSKETSSVVPVVIFILIVAGLIFAVSLTKKSRAKALKSFAEQRGYQFCYEDRIQGIEVTEKCNSTIGLKGKVATNIVYFKENNESHFIFTWEDMKQRNYNVCLIETETNFNCHILILPLGKFPGAFKAVAAMGISAIRGLDEVKLNNPEFDNNFTLYTDNKSIASQLLRDEVIRHTLEHLSKFRTGPTIWGLGKNMIAVCSRKLHSEQEIENLVNYTKKLQNYLIKK